MTLASSLQRSLRDRCATLCLRCERGLFIATIECPIVRVFSVADDDLERAVMRAVEMLEERIAARCAATLDCNRS